MSTSHAKAHAKPHKSRPFESILDRLGNQNPQLLREFRGRLKPGFVLATLGTSIAGQLLYGLNRLGSLPINVGEFTHEVHRYCLGPIPKQFSDPSCVKDVLGNITINWPLWWGEGLPVFHWTMVSIAIVIGCYLLIADWSTEADRGTLNSLRLSPQSAPSFFWGKFLGVPVLVYLFLLSGLPLFLTAMAGAGRSPATMLGGLAIDLAQMMVWFTTSLLFAACFTKGGGAKAILGAMVVAMGLWSAFYITSHSPLGWMVDLMRLISPSLGLAGGLPSSESSYSWSYSYQYLQGNKEWVWFGWPIGSSMVRLSLFTVGVLGVWSYGCWLALNRRFDRPTATLWSKGQSYGITAVVTTIVLGTIKIHPEFTSNSVNNFICSQMPLFWMFMPLGLSLIQSRQSLLDWVRHPAVPTARRAVAHRRDLIWGESSPPWVALGINVAIVALILIPYNLLRFYVLENGSIANVGWTFLLLSNLGLLLVGLSQLINLRARQRAGFLTAITVAVGLFALPTGLAIFSQYTGQNPLWLMTFYPLDTLDKVNASGMVIAIVGAEWLGLALIYRQFDRSLRRLAKSDFAQAVDPHKSATQSANSPVT
jgi:hypothetical protein